MPAFTTFCGFQILILFFFTFFFFFILKKNMWIKTFLVCTSLRLNFQKKPPDVFYKESCSYKFLKTHRKKSVPESLFQQSYRLKLVLLLENRLWHRFSPINFEKSLRTSFSQNASGWLLVNLECECKSKKLVYFSDSQQ